MRRNGRSLKAGERVRVGRHTISVPERALDVGPGPAHGGKRPAGNSDRQPAIDPSAVQYLDPVRAIFRPTVSDNLAPGLERFIGKEDIFRHVGEADMAPHGIQAMMQCPPHWPNGVSWVPIRDLEILEILDDQEFGRADAGFTRCRPRSGLRMIRKRRLPGAGQRVKVGRR